jgi:hypothetical protein
MQCWVFLANTFFNDVWHFGGHLCCGQNWCLQMFPHVWAYVKKHYWMATDDVMVEIVVYQGIYGR